MSANWLDAQHGAIACSLIWSLHAGKLYGELDSLESERMVLTALKKGLNYIDTAPYYGQGKSEKALGTILQAVPRKAFYIGTKVDFP